MRVLHLIDPVRAGWSAGHALSLALTPSDRVVVVGGDASVRRAGTLGLPVRNRVIVPGGALGIGARSLRRLIHAGRGADVVHAWSWSDLALAQRAAARTPLVATLAGEPATGRGSRSPGATGRAVALCLSESALLAARAVGLTARRARPPCDGGAARGGDRAALRRAWGAPDGTLLVALVGEPESATDARAFAFAMCVVAATYRRIAGVVSVDATQGERALRFIERVGTPWPLLFVDEPPWRIAAGVDIALWMTGDGPRPPDPVGLRWALARGLPVVVEETPAGRAAAAGGANVSFGRVGSSRDISRALLAAVESAGGPGAVVGGAPEGWMTAPEWRDAVGAAHREAAGDTVAPTAAPAPSHPAAFAARS